MEPLVKAACGKCLRNLCRLGMRAQVVVGLTLDEQSSDRDGVEYDEVCGRVSCGRDGKVLPVS